jgi:hypothetical protein
LQATRQPARRACERGTSLALAISVEREMEPSAARGRDDVEPGVDELTVDQGGGPPPGMPWTLCVRDEDWAADLEHAAPLPRVGDRIEYIGEDGARRVFRVDEVVHTIQASAVQRPPVRDASRGPNTLVNDRELRDGPRELRAGLPRVVVSVEG